MMTNKLLLQMTTATVLCAAPLLAFGQANTGGSSQMPVTTQSTDTPGGVTGAPAARGAAQGGSEMTSGQSTGPATGPTARPGGSNAQGSAQGTTGTSNPSGAGTGSGLVTSGGTAAAPGAPPSTNTQGGPGTPAQNPGPRSDAGRTGANPGSPPAAGAGQQAAANASGATAGAMAVDSAALRTGRRASRVIGSSIYNENNESIGEVEDILIPQGGGQPVAILSVGGFLGIGSRLVAVPYERLQRGSDRDRWTLQGATRDSVRSMPEFRYQDS